MKCLSRFRLLLSALPLSAILAGSTWLTANALAVPSARLHAAFDPEIPGHSTTVEFRLQITPGDEIVPPPLTEANVRFPAGLDITLSGLGIDACSTATIELSGPQACPADSLMGEGRTTVEFPIKHELFRETAHIEIVRTAEQDGHLAMLLCVYGEPAVDAQIILASQLLPASGPFGGLLNIQVPLVASLPEAPDVAVAAIQLVLGPKGLTYYEHLHHEVVAYKPTGIDVPRHCPRGGFPFAIELRFLGGDRATSTTAVPCPRGSSRTGRA